MSLPPIGVVAWAFVRRLSFASFGAWALGRWSRLFAGDDFPAFALRLFLLLLFALAIEGLVRSELAEAAPRKEPED